MQRAEQMGEFDQFNNAEEESKDQASLEEQLDAGHGDFTLGPFAFQ